MVVASRTDRMSTVSARKRSNMAKLRSHTDREQHVTQRSVFSSRVVGHRTRKRDKLIPGHDCHYPSRACRHGSRTDTMSTVSIRKSQGCGHIQTECKTSPSGASASDPDPPKSQRRSASNPPPTRAGLTQLPTAQRHLTCPAKRLRRQSQRHSASSETHASPIPMAQRPTHAPETPLSAAPHCV